VSQGVVLRDMRATIREGTARRLVRSRQARQPQAGSQASRFKKPQVGSHIIGIRTPQTGAQHTGSAAGWLAAVVVQAALLWRGVCSRPISGGTEWLDAQTGSQRANRFHVNGLANNPCFAGRAGNAPKQDLQGGQGAGVGKQFPARRRGQNSSVILLGYARIVGLRG